MSTCMSRWLTSDACGDLGESLVEECGKSIEVGKGVERPARHARAVPMSLPWHWLFDDRVLRSRSCALPEDRCGVLRVQRSTGDSHTGFGRSHLERVRGVLVHLDADVRTHSPDSETVNGRACGWPMWFDSNPRSGFRRLQVVEGARRDAGEPHVRELEPHTKGSGNSMRFDRSPERRSSARPLLSPFVAFLDAAQPAGLQTSVRQDFARIWTGTACM